jgi:ABC-type nitrate/sulfonate/bicarbonate transport system substrate-binding protein
MTALWYTRCPLPTASGLAISGGFFDAEFADPGIAVRSLRDAAQDVREQHFDHGHPALFRQGGNIPPIWARSRGARTRLIGLSWPQTFQAVIGLPGRGPQTAADLADARIALPRHVHGQIDFWRAMALRGVLSAAASAGLDGEALHFVDVEVSEGFLTEDRAVDGGSLFTARESARLWSSEALALVRGEVDAMYVYGPVGLQTVAFLDALVVADIASLDRRLQVNGSTPTALTVSAQLLEERPQDAERYVATLLRAADHAAQHPDDAFRVFAAEAGAGEEWARIAHPPDLPQRLRPTLDPELVDGLQAQIDFLMRHGFIDRPVDLDAWIDPRPLAAATRLADAVAF